MTMKSLMTAIALAAAISQPAMAQGGVPVPFRGPTCPPSTRVVAPSRCSSRCWAAAGPGNPPRTFHHRGEWHVNVHPGLP